MKETTAENDSLSLYAKELIVAKAKEGKTVGLVAGALGVLPWQRYGGIVDRPEHLHVIALDQGAAAGIAPFLKMCDAPKEAFKLKIYNMQEEVQAASGTNNDWNFDFYNALIVVIKRIQDKVQGNSAILISSLTTLAVTLQRGIAGPPGNEGKKGGGMDQSKWPELSRQLNEIRNIIQRDKYHTIWEGHVYKAPGMGGNDSGQKESIQVQGAAGHNFPNNVEHVLRFRRDHGNTFGETRIDRIFLDTQPSMDFIPGGRMITEKLAAKEECMTLAFAKLGYKVGRWNSKKTK